MKTPRFVSSPVLLLVSPQPTEQYVQSYVILFARNSLCFLSRLLQWPFCPVRQIVKFPPYALAQILKLPAADVHCFPLFSDGCNFSPSNCSKTSARDACITFARKPTAKFTILFCVKSLLETVPLPTALILNCNNLWRYFKITLAWHFTPEKAAALILRGIPYVTKHDITKYRHYLLTVLWSTHGCLPRGVSV